MGDSHRLLFNKFNIYHKHLLVVTRQFESQKDRLTRKDLVNGALACEALQGVLFFNGGDLSGSSQPHKHMQVLPSEARELPIFSEIYQYIQSRPEGPPKEIVRFDKFDFLHGIVAIRPTEPFQPLGELLYEAYRLLYEELITKNKEKYALISDYNVIACETYILMVIRKKERAFDQLSVNSVGSAYPIQAIWGPCSSRNRKCWRNSLKTTARPRCWQTSRCSERWPHPLWAGRRMMDYYVAYSPYYIFVLKV
jgi:sulfate adenylyltransferase (ADP) / ATP adenylyltransferase